MSVGDYVTPLILSFGSIAYIALLGTVDAIQGQLSPEYLMQLGPLGLFASLQMLMMKRQEERHTKERKEWVTQLSGKLDVLTEIKTILQERKQ